MKSLTNDNPGADTCPPAWLPTNLLRYWSPQAPDKMSVAGDYVENELWMLENHVRDMERGISAFVIAPMGTMGGVGTYRM